MIENRKEYGHAVSGSDGGRTWNNSPEIPVGQVIDHTTGEMVGLRATDLPLKTDEGEPMTEPGSSRIGKRRANWDDVSSPVSATAGACGAKRT